MAAKESGRRNFFSDGAESVWRKLTAGTVHAGSLAERALTRVLRTFSAGEFVYSCPTLLPTCIIATKLLSRWKNELAFGCFVNSIPSFCGGEQRSGP